MTLKSGDTEAIRSLFSALQREINALVENVIELIYFMRGAISYEEMMNRTYGERQRFSEFIEKRLESQKKAMYPVY